jgi:hypothetical protein
MSNAYTTTTIFGFSNNSSWLINHFLLMDMFILTKAQNTYFLTNQLNYNDLFDQYI